MSQTESSIEELERHCVKDDSKKLAAAVKTSAFRDLHRQPYVNEKNSEEWPSVGAYLLWFAVMKSAIACVKVILPFVEVDVRDQDQWTVLHQAAWDNYSEITRVLVDAGADVNATDRVGYSPIHVAAVSGNVQTLAVLCASKGADLNMQDINGETPLYKAVLDRCTECVSTLLDFGASTDIRDAAGQTPKELAAGKGYDDIVRLLDGKASLSEGGTVSQLHIPATGLCHSVGEDTFHFGCHGRKGVSMIAPTVKNIQAEFNDSSGAKLRVEKVVAMGPSNSAPLDMSVSVDLHTKPIAEEDKVYLVRTNSNRMDSKPCEGRYHKEFDRNAVEISCSAKRRPSADKTADDLRFQIVDESGQCASYVGDECVDNIAVSTYSNFHVDRANCRVKYEKNVGGLDVILVSSVPSKKLIAKLILDSADHKSCRFLIYAQEGLDQGVRLCIKGQTSPIFEAPVEQAIKSGWQQIGLTDDWFLLNPDEHWIRCELELDKDGKSDWQMQWERCHEPVCLDLLLNLCLRYDWATPKSVQGLVSITATSKPIQGLFHALQESRNKITSKVRYDRAGMEPSLPRADAPVSQMSWWHCRLLRGHYRLLTGQLVLDIFVLDSLRTKLILPWKLYKTIRSMCDPVEQNQLFLDNLPSCGPDSFSALVATLQESNQLPNQQLAKTLKEAAEVACDQQDVLDNAVKTLSPTATKPDVLGGSFKGVRQQLHDLQSAPVSGESDPWESTDYRRCYAKLIRTMDPDEVKTLCYALQLISDIDKQIINSKTTSFAKNEAILDIVSRSSRHFGKFREVLHHIEVCADIAKHLDKIGQRRDQDQGCLEARRFLNG